MLFNSWEFLVLCLVTLGLYYLPISGKGRKLWQITVLLIASALFYAWENPKLLILLSASCLFNAIAVERILFWKSDPSGATSHEVLPPKQQISSPTESSQGVHSNTLQFQDSSKKKADRWLAFTVAVNLAFLAFFKYAGFFLNVLPSDLIPTNLHDWLKNIPLPVGISFYTFQGISLVVDVWRKDISPHTANCLSGRGRERIKAVRDVSFYISFFPQLVAGPIVKAHEFVDQIGSKQFSDIDWQAVRRYLIVGYFLKIFVADNLAEQTASLSLGAAQLESSGPFNLIPLLYAYSLQIFADFAGYSLIAIGLGAIFGYTLPPNFNFPYLSTSITEFWRRWHLSLSSWLRDYLYFPLGGNRKGSGRTYFNLFLVMFLGGLWHGAAWKFALWGSLHGVFLALERLAASASHTNAASLTQKPNSEQATGSSTSKSYFGNKRITTSLKLLFKWFVTFHLITVLWLTFLMPDIASIFAFFKGIFNGSTSFAGPPIFSLLFYGTAIILYHSWGWLQEHQKPMARKLARSPIEPIIHAAMLFLVITNPGAPRGFIYFQF